MAGENVAPVERHDPWAGFAGHEEVVVAVDRGTGLHMVIAIHSTVLGPALGGTRLQPYVNGADAYADALRLSRAMTQKNALAGLPHGGGKAVLIGEPGTLSSDALHAYGSLVASLGGRYVTAADVGIRVQDMDVIGEACAWTTGRSPERGGLGDSGILTAVGVFAGMRACARHRWGSDDLSERTVLIQGAGKVGGRLAAHVSEAGGRVVVVDPSPRAVDDVLALVPGASAVGTLEEGLELRPDFFSPNALGGVLTTELAARIGPVIVCGAANNQLATPGAALTLAEAGALYAPDFLVNCGGVIQVAAEFAGETLEAARARAEAVYDTTLRVLERADREGLLPVAAAEAEAAAIVARGPRA